MKTLNLLSGFALALTVSLSSFQASAQVPKSGPQAPAGFVEVAKDQVEGYFRAVIVAIGNKTSFSCRGEWVDASGFFGSMGRDADGISYSAFVRADGVTQPVVILSQWSVARAGAATIAVSTNSDLSKVTGFVFNNYELKDVNRGNLIKPVIEKDWVVTGTRNCN